jgi:DNA-binding response OmpR family regulator
MAAQMKRGRDTPVVAVVNTNPDIVRLIRVELERAGFLVLVIHIEDIKIGSTDINDMLRQHNPRVIVYDVAPPYEQNWRFLDHLRTTTDFKGRRFVLTSVNVERLRKMVTMEESVHEVAGEPTDLEAIVRAVKEASRARPTR